MPINRTGVRMPLASIWPRNVDVKPLNCRPQSPDDFARPERYAQNRDPAIFRLANDAERIARVSLLVSVQAAFGKITFQSRVRRSCSTTRAEAKSFACEALEQLPQLFRTWRRNYDAAFRRFPPFNLTQPAEFSHAVEVAEK